MFLNKNRSTDEERACTCNTIREILCTSLLILFFPCLFYPYPLLPLLFLSPYYLYFFSFRIPHCGHGKLSTHSTQNYIVSLSLLKIHPGSSFVIKLSSVFFKIDGISSIKMKPAFHPPQMNISPKFVSV